MTCSGEASDDAHVPVIETSVLGLEYFCGTISQRGSYEGQATVSTPTDLRLVHVDPYLRVSQWSSASVTGHSPCLYPSYWLLVNEIDGCFWLRLRNSHPSQRIPSIALSETERKSPKLMEHT